MMKAAARKAGRLVEVIKKVDEVVDLALGGHEGLFRLGVSYAYAAEPESRCGVGESRHRVAQFMPDDGHKLLLRPYTVVHALAVCRVSAPEEIEHPSNPVSDPSERSAHSLYRYHYSNVLP
jgi:hypothetical protein